MSKENTGDKAGGAGAKSSAAAVPQATADSGNASERKMLTRPAFVGRIFPAPLDEEGNVQEGVGPGSAHFLACVYPYDKSQESPAGKVHGELDKKFGQPFFVAFIYPNPNLRDDELDVDEVLGGGGGGHSALGGGGGGHSALGGVEGGIIYTGEFHSFTPVEKQEGGGSDAGSHSTAPASTPSASTPSASTPSASPPAGESQG
jgi:hypothetical protein